jgi:hypothetical protein
MDGTSADKPDVLGWSVQPRFSLFFLCDPYQISTVQRSGLSIPEEQRIFAAMQSWVREPAKSPASNDLMTGRGMEREQQAEHLRKSNTGIPSGQIENVFENKANVTHQVGQQNVYGDINFYQSVYSCL